MTVETFAWFGNTDDATSSDRRALILPGANYSLKNPLLHFVARTLVDRGWFVQGVSWEVDETARANPASFTAMAAELAAVHAPPATTTIVVGKSLGTRAAAWAANRQLPGIWLTPMLYEESVVAAISGSTVPTLVIGGSADPAWDGDVARRLGSSDICHVYEIEDADHNLEVSGSWRASLAALNDVLSDIETFVEGLDSH